MSKAICGWRYPHVALLMRATLLVEGTMETMSKAALCAPVVAATIKVMADLRVWRRVGKAAGR
jgi:hypothetical protein